MSVRRGEHAVHADSARPTDTLELLAVLDGLLDEAAAGRRPRSMARLAERGKLPIRERVALALDRDSPFLENLTPRGVGLGLHRRRRDAARRRGYRRCRMCDPGKRFFFALLALPTKRVSLVFREVPPISPVASRPGLP